MQPTMKLRYVKREVPAWNGMIGGPPCSKVIDVLQQWWEGAKIKKEYEHLAPGSLIHYDGSYPLMAYEPYGEWRDIPIEEEK